VPLAKVIDKNSTESESPRFYSNTRTIWVEPRTGVIVKGQEDQKHTARDADGEDAITLVDASLVWNDETIEKQTGEAKKSLDRINMLTRTLPIGLGIAGAVLALLGLALLLTGRRSTPRH
jgi:hypothetical protein